METDQLKAEIERLESEAAALREALAAVEWVEVGDHDFCPWCGNWGVDGHRDDCLRQITLAADAGRAFSERLRRTERERDEAVAAYDALAGEWHAAP